MSPIPPNGVVERETEDMSPGSSPGLSKAVTQRPRECETRALRRGNVGESPRTRMTQPSGQGRRGRVASLHVAFPRER